jgi:hypothetical protein
MTHVASEFFPPESGPLSCLTKPVAVLRLKPEELSERIGIRFQAAHDDLDVLDWARVIGLSGRAYALVHHRHSPEPGTQIVVPYDSSDLWEDVLDVLKALKLTKRDLAWTSPEAVPGSQIGSHPKGTPRVRHVSGRLLLKVPPRVSSRLRKVQGRGGFHALLRKFEKRVKGTELVVTPNEVEKLLGYSAELGTSPSRTSVSHRKSFKKTSRKK